MTNSTNGCRQGVVRVDDKTMLHQAQAEQASSGDVSSQLLAKLTLSTSGQTELWHKNTPEPKMTEPTIDDAMLNGNEVAVAAAVTVRSEHDIDTGLLFY